MENPQKKINIDEDRLSNLPGDVIERILELLSVPDAARTCVLSSKWRYVWVNHPSLVLDDTSFWNDRLLNKSLEKVGVLNHHIVYENIVSSVLLSHIGDIRKFVFDISNVIVSQKNLDFWLSYLCRKSLKVLHFKDSDKDVRCRYEVPSSVFLTFKLTDLSLEHCHINETVGCFNSIQSLVLESVHVESVVLTTPLLTSLSVTDCISLDTDVVFDISAPKLASLTLNDNNFFNLQPFFTCTDIEYVFLSPLDEDSVKCDGKRLLDLLALWPKVSALVVDGCCFKELAPAGSIPDHIGPLNLRRFALWRIDLDREKIAWILYVLKNSPLLRTFEIWFEDEEKNDIDELSIMDFEMGQLRTINIEGFTASRNEVIFINILLKSAPLLEKILVEENKNLDPLKQIKILKELLLLQTTYRNTKIVFAQNLLPRDF